jgi:hypothetical protein
MVACITTFCPRNTGYGWELQKLHNHYHIMLDLLYFHHCSVWDTGTGEWLLKTFFKELASTCQEHNSKEFMMQIANRTQERLALVKVLQSLEKKANYDAIVEKRCQAEQEATRLEEHLFLVNTLITLCYRTNYTQCSFRWNGKNQSAQVHPIICHWFACNWN